MSTPRGVWFDRLLVLAALSLGGLVLYTSQAVTTSETLGREQHLLEVWRRDELSSLTLSTPRGELRLDKHAADDGESSEWVIASRGNAKADPAAVDGLLETLRFAIWVRQLDAEADRTELGLSQPRASLNVSMGALRYRVLLGKQATGPSGGAYVEVTRGEQRALGIVKPQLVEALTADPRQYLGRLLVPHSRSDIDRLELDGVGGPRHLRRVGHRFRFDGMHENQLVDDHMLDPVFFHLARVSAESFLPQAQAEAALKQGERVSIRLSAGKHTTRLVVGGQCPKQPTQVVAFRQQPTPLAACVSKTVMAGLTIPASELTDLTAFGFSMDSVEKVTATLGDRRLDLVRNNEGYQLRAPVEAPVQLQQGNSRVTSLVESRGQQLESPNLDELGLKPAQGSMTLTGLSSVSNEAVDETIDLGKPDAQGRLPIFRRLDGVTLLLPPEAARAFRIDATLSKNLRIFDFGERTLDQLHVRTDALQQSLVRRGGEYELEAPAGFSPDASLVSALLDSLKNLEAERWVSDTDQGTFGLETPMLVLDLVTKSKSSSTERRLTVGAEVPGGAYASVSGVPGVFVVSSPALRQLTTPVLSREPLLVDTSLLVTVRLKTHKREVVLKANAGHWVSDSPGVSPEHADKIIRGIENLKPAFAQHTGRPASNEGFSAPILQIDVVYPERPTQTLKVGAPHVFGDLTGHYIRADGYPASFAISSHAVQRLLDLL